MKHEAPHSPQRRRERLNLRMKSLSLDSPEGSAHVRHRPRDYYVAAHGKDSTPPRHSDSGSINRLCEYRHISYSNLFMVLRCKKLDDFIQVYQLCETWYCDGTALSPVKFWRTAARWLPSDIRPRKRSIVEAAIKPEPD